VKFSTTNESGNISRMVGNLQFLPPSQQQPLSHLSSVATGDGTYYFEIDAQGYVEYTNNAGQTWTNTGDGAYTVSAGIDGLGNADVWVIGGDNNVYVIHTASAGPGGPSSGPGYFSNLGLNGAKAISALQGPLPASPHQNVNTGGTIVYALGPDNQLYMNTESGSNSTWKLLGTPSNAPLVTISAVGTQSFPPGGGRNLGSVCFATDSNGYVWEFSTPDDITGTWIDTGGRNAVQIAASFGSNSYAKDSMVYVLTNDGTVKEWGDPRTGNTWTSLGSGFVEISADRTDPSITGVPQPVTGIVYAIAASSHNLHELTIYKDKNLGGNATAVTSEGGVALATDQHYNPWVYADPHGYDPWYYNLPSNYTGWYNLNGPQMWQQSTPVDA
jgi:hypothetical protein